MSFLYAPDAKILVVDDSPINLNIVCELLRQCGITGETAKNGKQAIEMIRNKHYDIVFMDHFMPEIDGLEAAKIIRKMGIDVPIIAFTAADEFEGVKEYFLNAGFNDILTKPIYSLVLIKLLKSWLPMEKIVYKENKKDINEADSNDIIEFKNKFKHIEGLSVTTGLQRVSGRWDVYEKSLEFIVTEIAKCDKNLNVFLASGDTQNFLIEAHSIKGSLANIGAMELSTRALELETASGKKDMAFCTENLPSFLEDLNNLKHNLSSIFAKTAKEYKKIELPPELPLIFKKLMSSLDEENYISIEHAVDKLKELDSIGEPLQEEIEKIADAVLVTDYDTARKIMQGLMT